MSTGAGHTDLSVIGALRLENDGRTSFEANTLDEIVTDMWAERLPRAVVCARLH